MICGCRLVRQDLIIHKTGKIVKASSVETCRKQIDSFEQI